MCELSRRTHGRKKEITKIKYTQNIFPEAWKIVETTHPAQSFSRVTKPMQTPLSPESQKCNLFIKKLINMNPNELLTFIKELQASTQQSKQISPLNPIHTTKKCSGSKNNTTTMLSRWKTVSKYPSTPKIKIIKISKKTTLLYRNHTHT